MTLPTLPTRMSRSRAKMTKSGWAPTAQLIGSFFAGFGLATFIFACAESGDGAMHQQAKTPVVIDMQQAVANNAAKHVDHVSSCEELAALTRFTSIRPSAGIRYEINVQPPVRDVMPPSCTLKSSEPFENHNTPNCLCFVKYLFGLAGISVKHPGCATYEVRSSYTMGRRALWQNTTLQELPQRHRNSRTYIVSEVR